MAGFFDFHTKVAHNRGMNHKIYISILLGFLFVSTVKADSCEWIKRHHVLSGMSESQAQDLSKRKLDALFKLTKETEHLPINEAKLVYVMQTRLKMSSDESLKMLEVFKSEPRDINIQRFLGAIESLPFVGLTLKHLYSKTSPKTVIKVVERLMEGGIDELLLKKKAKLTSIEQIVLEIVFTQRWYILKLKKWYNRIYLVRPSSLINYMVNSLYKHRNDIVYNDIVLDDIISSKLTTMALNSSRFFGFKNVQDQKTLQVKNLSFYLENFHQPSQVISHLEERLKVFDLEIKNSKSGVLSWMRTPWLRHERRRTAALLQVYKQHFSESDIDEKQLAKTLSRTKLEWISQKLSSRWPETWTSSLEEISFSYFVVPGLLLYGSASIAEWTADPFGLIFEDEPAFDEDSLPIFEEEITEEQKEEALQDLIKNKDLDKNKSAYEQFLDDVAAE